MESIRCYKPEEIEKRSMEIIGERLAGNWSEAEEAVVRRCIHTSADFDYARNLVFSPGVVEKAMEAVQKGAAIVTDTRMAAAGINARRLEGYGGRVICYMADDDVAAEARARGITRASVSMERAASLKGPVIFAIGNAPTALIRISELIRSKIMDPAVVIGVPVGFVNVVESKNMILETDVSSIVAMGNKGGSNIAAAICNAVLYQMK